MATVQVALWLLVCATLVLYATSQPCFNGDTPVTATVSSSLSSEPRPGLPGYVAMARTYPAGSIIVAMDNVLQNRVEGTCLPSVLPYFNLKAYGFVNALLNAGVPVDWVIRNNKGKDNFDLFNIDTIPFSGDSVCIGLPILPISLPRSFAGGPFVIDASYRSTLDTVASAFNGAVMLYEAQTPFTGDVRHELRSTPFVGVSNADNKATIHEDMLVAAGFQSGVHFTRINSDDLASIGTTTCLTIVTEPHFGTSAHVPYTSAARSFLASGGNMLAQCAAIETYELAEFWSTAGVLRDNAAYPFFYENPTTAFSQFVGDINNPSGSVRNWELRAGSVLQPDSYVVVGAVPLAADRVGEQFTATVAQVETVDDRLGGLLHYLGGHEYDDSIFEERNAIRMYMNAVMTPTVRPDQCGFQLSGDLRVSLSDSSDAINPVTQATSYTYTAENVGGTTLANVELDIAIDPALTVVMFPGCTSLGGNTFTCTVGSLAAGASQSFTAQVTGAAVGLVGTTVAGSTSSSEANGNTGNNFACQDTRVCDVTADGLTVSKLDLTAAGVRPYMSKGELVQFTVALENGAGVIDVTNVLIKEVATDFDIVSGTALTAGSSFDLETLTWTVPTVAAGLRALLLIEAKSNVDGVNQPLTNQVCIEQSDEYLSASPLCATYNGVSPPFVAEKTASKSSVADSEVFEYDIRISNPTASTFPVIEVFDDFPTDTGVMDRVEVGTWELYDVAPFTFTEAFDNAGQPFHNADVSGTDDDDWGTTPQRILDTPNGFLTPVLELEAVASSPSGVEITLPESNPIENVVVTVRYWRDSMDSDASLTYLNDQNVQVEFGVIPQGDDSAFVTESFSVPNDLVSPNPLFSLLMGPPILAPSNLYVDEIVIAYSIKTLDSSGALEPIVPNSPDLLLAAQGVTLGPFQQLDINYAVSITASQPGTAVNDVSVTSSALPSNAAGIVPVRASAEVEVIPNMVVTKTASVTHASQGDVVTYTVDVVVNFPLSNVDLVDVPSAGLAFQAGSATTTDLLLRGARMLAVPAQTMTLGAPAPLNQTTFGGEAASEWDKVAVLNDGMPSDFSSGVLTHFVANANEFQFDEFADDPQRLRFKADLRGLTVLEATLRFRYRRDGANKKLFVQFNNDNGARFTFPANGEVDGGYVDGVIPDVELFVSDSVFFVDFFVENPMASGATWNLHENVVLEYSAETTVPANMAYPNLIQNGAFTTPGTAQFQYDMLVVGSGPTEENTVTGTTTTVMDLFTATHSLVVQPQMDLSFSGETITPLTAGATLDFDMRLELGEDGSAVAPPIQINIAQGPCTFDFVSAVATFGGLASLQYQQNFLTGVSTFPAGPWSLLLCPTCLIVPGQLGPLATVSINVDLTGLVVKSATFTVEFMRDGGSLDVAFLSAMFPLTTPLSVPASTDGGFITLSTEVGALLDDMTSITMTNAAVGDVFLRSVTLDLVVVQSANVPTADPNFGPLLSYGNTFQPGDAIDVALTMAVPSPLPGGLSCTLTASSTGGDTEAVTVQFIRINDDAVVSIQGRSAIFRLEGNDQGPIAGGQLTISSPPAGTAAPSPLFNGRVFYTPPSMAFVGTDSFDYVKCDTTNTVCESATVTVTVLETVTASDDGPFDLLLNDPTVLGTLLDNDMGTIDATTLTIVTPLALPGNTLSVDAFGEVTATWGASPAGPRTDSFQYQVCSSEEMDFDSCPSSNRFNCDTATAELRLLDCHITVTYNHECNGRVTLNVMNATAPLMFMWAPDAAIADQTQSFQDDLPPGTYYVSVTDAFGCEANDVEITVVRASVPSMLASIAALRCSGGTTVTLRYEDNYACNFGDLEFTIDWGDSTTPDTYTPGPPDVLRVGGEITATHRYTSRGVFTASYTLTYTTDTGMGATDLSGSSSGTVDIIVGADVGLITNPPYHRVGGINDWANVVAIPMYEGVEITWTIDRSLGDPLISSVDIAVVKTSSPDRGTVYPLETGYPARRGRYVWTPHHLFEGWYDITLAVPAPDFCEWQPRIRVRLYSDVQLYCNLPVSSQYIPCRSKRDVDGSKVFEMGKPRGTLALS